MSQRWLLGVAAVVIVVGAVWVFFSTRGAVGVNTLVIPAITMAPVKTIEIEAGGFYFKPNEIRVNKGDQVRVVIKAVSMMHDFNIDDLNVHSEIVKNGDTGTVEFTATQMGTFEYYCSVADHRQKGQIGTLVIEE